MEAQTIIESAEKTESPVSLVSKLGSGYSEHTRIATLVAISVLVYINTLLNSFALDDFLYIFNNPAVTSPSIKLLFSATKDFNVFRPITFATLALNWAAGGTHAWGYHLVNLLLHAAVTVLLYLVLKKLLEALVYGTTVAWVAALLFAVHPIHTEAVAGIVNRSELLAAGWLLGAWLLHLNDWPVASLLCFLMAMLAKESAVAFLPLVVLGDHCRGEWKRLSRYVGIAATAALYLAVLWKAQGGRFGERGISGLDNPLAYLSPILRICNALRVAWKYVALQLYPAALSGDYSYNAITLYSDWKHLVPAVVGTAIVLALWTWALWTGRKGWALAGSIYLAAFAVTANILVPTGTIMGERLAYLPSAGFCLLVAMLWIECEKRNRRVAWSVLGIVALLLAVRTVVRNRDWRDNFAIFSSAVRAVPENAKARSGLGGEYLRRSELQEARKELQISLDIYPDSADALNSLGLVEARLGHDQEALGLFQKALAMAGNNDLTHDNVAANLAEQLIKVRMTDDALRLLNNQISASPGYSRNWSIRAAVWALRGDWSSARADVETALRLDPSNKQAQDLLRLVDRFAPRP